MGRNWVAMTTAPTEVRDGSGASGLVWWDWVRGREALSPNGLRTLQWELHRLLLSLQALGRRGRRQAQRSSAS